MNARKGTVKGVGDVYWWHRINLPGYGYTEGYVNHGPDGGDWPTKRFGMPESLHGMTVLDIGAWDGFFSFEAERRGAKSVLATDCPTEEGGTHLGSAGFWYAKKALNSAVKWKKFNLEIDPPFAEFNLVLCFGVLYHVKSPLVALTKLFNLTASGGICLVETAITTVDDVPLLEYRPYFDDDPTNYFYPNKRWMHIASKTIGFSSCDLIYEDTHRATFRLQKGKITED